MEDREQLLQEYQRTVLPDIGSAAPVSLPTYDEIATRLYGQLQRMSVGDTISIDAADMYEMCPDLHTIVAEAGNFAQPFSYHFELDYSSGMDVWTVKRIM